MPIHKTAINNVSLAFFTWRNSWGWPRTCRGFSHSSGSRPGKRTQTELQNWLLDDFLLLLILKSVRQINKYFFFLSNSFFFHCHLSLGTFYDTLEFTDQGCHSSHQYKTIPTSAHEKAVFPIRDILVRIRIPDPYHWITDPAIFFSGFQRANKR
jgi:hypothetical protein